MNAALPQERLGEVSAMAVTLANRILMERLTEGNLPVAKAKTLWIASLLLEENEQPVPTIVTEVLAEFRHFEAANDAETSVEAFPEKSMPKPTRFRGRLLRPSRAAVTA